MEKETEQLIRLALEEDFGAAGDVTSAAIFGRERLTATLLAKDSGVLAGSEVFSGVFQLLDPATRLEFHFPDGAALAPGMKVADLEGEARVLLGGERTALNFISFLSGIATKTRRYVEESARYGRTLILDTRKTLPAFRRLSKYAVRVGGGRNHRLGLYEMALIKDNHIDAAGSLTRAVEKVRARWGKTLRIETECRDLDEVRQALSLNVDIIMLDNMELGTLKEAIALVAGRIPVEISGRVRLENLKELVPLAAEYVSVGALTHSVESFDFSLEIDVPYQ